MKPGTQRGHAQRQHDEQQGEAEDRGGPDCEELARLEPKVGTGDVAGKVRPEVACLYHPVELGQGHALLDDLAQAT